MNNDNTTPIPAEKLEMVYNIFKAKYLESSLFDGMIPINSDLLDYENNCDAMYKLVDAGILEKRQCEGTAYQLTKEERNKIDAANISETKKEAAPVPEYIVWWNGLDEGKSAELKEDYFFGIQEEDLKDADIKFIYESEKLPTAIPEPLKESTSMGEGGFTKGKWSVGKTALTETTSIWVGGTLIATMADVPHEGSEANAQRIVTCVNAYDGLVSTLNGLLNIKTIMVKWHPLHKHKQRLNQQPTNPLPPSPNTREREPNKLFNF